jgi:transcriptional regulator with XRE-family HTH domain
LVKSSKKIHFTHFFIRFWLFSLIQRGFMRKEEHLGLKKFRKRLGISQQQMAEKLGVNRVTYANWELGNSEPPFAIIKKSLVMGATVDELFGVGAELPREDTLQIILKRIEKIEEKLQ